MSLAIIYAGDCPAFFISIKHVDILDVKCIFVESNKIIKEARICQMKTSILLVASNMKS